MDCLICYKIFVKQIDYKNTSLNSKICANSFSKLLEIPNSKTIGEIFNQPVICIKCNQKLIKVNQILTELENLQRRFNDAQEDIQNDLANSIEVSDSLRDQNQPLSQSSLFRQKLLQEIDFAKASTEDTKSSVPTPSTSTNVNQNGMANSWDLSPNLITAFSELCKNEPVLPKFEEALSKTDPLEFLNSEAKPKLCLERIYLPPGVSRINLKDTPHANLFVKPGNPQNNQPAEIFQCGFCPKTFSSKKKVKSHEIIHTDKWPVRCQHCSRGFLATRQLENHLEKMTSSKCKACNETFKSRGCLSHHNWIAHGINYNTTKTRHFKTMIENPERFTIECPVVGCPAKFIHIGNKNRHLRTVHQNSKDYQCQIPGCDKAYTSKINLKYHYKSVHDLIKTDS